MQASSTYFRPTRVILALLLCFSFHPSILAQNDRGVSAGVAATSAVSQSDAFTDKGIREGQDARTHAKNASDLRAKAQMLRTEKKRDEANRLESKAVKEERVETEDLQRSKRDFAQAVADKHTGNQDGAAALAAKRDPTESGQEVRSAAYPTSSLGRKPFDADYGKGDRVVVCLGDSCRFDPIQRDLATYPTRGVNTERATSFDDVIRKIRETPDDINRVTLDLHGGRDGTSYMPGIGSFKKDSSQFSQLWSSFRDLNNARAAKGVAPAEAATLQCWGATCALDAARISGTKVRASTKPTSIPQGPGDLQFYRR